MKEFTTITEYEILRLAWKSLLSKWLRELDIKEELDKNGEESSIIDVRANKYRSQLDEIESRMKQIQIEAE